MQKQGSDPNILPDITKTVVTKREDQPSQLVETTLGTNDVQIIAMPAWQITLVRTARVYLQTLVGFLTAATTGYAGALGLEIPVMSFGHLIVVSAGLAVAPAVMTLLQNIVELLAKLDQYRPTLRA